MKTYTELLPPSKSNPHRAMKFSPICRGIGVLELTDAKTHVRYAVAVQPFGGVRLTKTGGDETYVVSPAACECKGHVYSGARCKHIEAVETLQANGWLDDRETVSDTDADVQEMDQWYAGSRDGEPAGWVAEACGGTLTCEWGGA